MILTETVHGAEFVHLQRAYCAPYATPARLCHDCPDCFRHVARRCACAERGQPMRSIGGADSGCTMGFGRLANYIANYKAI